MPTGLNNLGNTCFMNSALQCLVSSDLFIQGYLIHRFFDGSVKEKEKKISRTDILNAMADLARHSMSNTSSFSPSLIKNLIANRNPLFRGYGQQDTQELLIFLLDELHEESNFIAKSPEPIIIDETDQDPDPVLVWQKYKQRFDSPIVDLFSGQYKGTVECQSCGHISNTYDPFQFISVPIPCSIEVLVLHDKIYQVKVSEGETVGSLKQKLADTFSTDFVVWDQWNNRLFTEKSDDSILEKNYIAYPKIDNYVTLRFVFKNNALPHPLLLNADCDLKEQVVELLSNYTTLPSDFMDNITITEEKVGAYCIELNERIDTENILIKQELNLIKAIDSNFKDFQVASNIRKQPGILTLEECLLHFMEPEELKDQGNLYKCPSCQAFRTALKYTLFNHIPPILIIQLKRFQSSGTDSYYSRAKKVEDFIDFPFELDIKELVVGEPVESPMDGSDATDPDYFKYELYAIDVLFKFI